MSGCAPLVSNQRTKVATKPATHLWSRPGGHRQFRGHAVVHSVFPFRHRFTATLYPRRFTSLIFVASQTGQKYITKQMVLRRIHLRHFMGEVICRGYKVLMFVSFSVACRTGLPCADPGLPGSTGGSQVWSQSGSATAI